MNNHGNTYALGRRVGPRQHFFAGESVFKVIYLEGDVRNGANEF